MRTYAPTKQEFATWAAHAAPGDKCVYHTGGCIDRTLAGRSVAQFVREMADESRVLDLVQYRVSDGLQSQFEYTAIRRKRPHKLPLWCNGPK